MMIMEKKLERIFYKEFEVLRENLASTSLATTDPTIKFTRSRTWTTATANS
jgi:hypothetical protein